MNWKFVVFVLLVILVLLASFVDKETPQEGQRDLAGEAAVQPVQNSGTCKNDADCFPASCCHATSCVAVAQKPNCEDVYCTLECQPDTLDCGQGSCACVQGKCVVVLE